MRKLGCRVTTSISWDIDSWAVLAHEHFVYRGPMEYACGATGAQQELQTSQINFYNEMTSQYATEFQNNQQILGALTQSFEPILSAGINQQGFSQAELNNLNSQATTGTGQNYANASAALARAQGAQGGGNAYVPSGEKSAQAAGLATSAAQQESGLESQIQEQDYATGRQNYLEAASILGGVASQDNPAAFAQAATGAGSAASTTANEVAQESNSWMGLVSGALGASGTALGGGSLGKIIGG